MRFDDENLYFTLNKNDLKTLFLFIYLNVSIGLLFEMSTRNEFNKEQEKYFFWMQIACVFCLLRIGTKSCIPASIHP